jgi:hypothetical protein
MTSCDVRKSLNMKRHNTTSGFSVVTWKAAMKSE